MLIFRASGGDLRFTFVPPIATSLELRWAQNWAQSESGHAGLAELSDHHGRDDDDTPEPPAGPFYFFCHFARLTVSRVLK